MPTNEENEEFQFRIKRTKETGPEAIIVNKLIKKLTLLDWLCVIMHGSIYQIGFPDIYATHSKFGPRLIEVKDPKNISFTPGQRELFPKLAAFGSGVWVLTSDSDEEIALLFRPYNYWHYFF